MSQLDSGKAYFYRTFKPKTLDSYLENVEQNDFKKIYRAKTPSTQRKIITYFSEPWRPLRLCARHVFPISSPSENFKYLWLVFLLLFLSLVSPQVEVCAAGLQTHFVEIILQNLTIGKSYSLAKERNLPLSITNTGDGPVVIKVEALTPEPWEIVGGFEPIPDPSWINFEADTFTVEPKGTGQTDIIIFVPDDRRYLRKKYQVVIFSRTISGMIGAGFRSRILFSIDTVK